MLISAQPAASWADGGGGGGRDDGGGGLMRSKATAPQGWGVATNLRISSSLGFILAYDDRFRVSVAGCSPRGASVDLRRRLQAYEPDGCKLVDD